MPLYLRCGSTSVPPFYRLLEFCKLLTRRGLPSTLIAEPWINSRPRREGREPSQPAGAAGSASALSPSLREEIAIRDSACAGAQPVTVAPRLVFLLRTAFMARVRWRDALWLTRLLALAVMFELSFFLDCAPQDAGACFPRREILAVRQPAGGGRFWQCLLAPLYAARQCYKNGRYGSRRGCPWPELWIRRPGLTSHSFLALVIPPAPRNEVTTMEACLPQAGISLAPRLGTFKI